VDDRQAGVEAHLLGGVDLGLARAALLAGGDELSGGRVLFRDACGDGVVGGDGDEARPEQGVGAGGVDFQALGQQVALAGVGELEGELGALRPADPVFLHEADLVRPAVQGRQVIGQLVGIVGDAEEPLVQLALLDHRAGAPAAAVHHLLVGQHRHVHGVPVDHALLAVDEAAGEQVQEQRLLLAVIGQVAGGEFAGPVDRKAQFLQLIAHPGDIFVGPGLGVDAALHGGVLGGQTKGVPAHGMQDREAPGALEPRDHVAQRVVAHVAHVQTPRRIGEHLQHVVLRP
jgi:hypothetical protein